MKDWSFDTAFSRMAALCSASEHCASEIREKLQRAAVPAEEIQRVVDRLTEERYLDTTRYCRAFSRDKLRFARWGRVKIEQALHAKGLPEEEIRRAINDLPEEEYTQILKDLLEQKNRSLRHEDDYTRRGKLLRFAAGRGFTMGEVMEALRSS